MGRQSKRAVALESLVDSKRKYTLEEAIPLLKRTASAKFDEAAEIAMHLGVNPIELPYFSRFRHRVFNSARVFFSLNE